MKKIEETIVLLISIYKCGNPYIIFDHTQVLLKEEGSSAHFKINNLIRFPCESF